MKVYYAFIYHYSHKKDTKFSWIVWNQNLDVWQAFFKLVGFDTNLVLWITILANEIGIQSDPRYTYTWGRCEIKLGMTVLLHFLF